MVKEIQCPRCFNKIRVPKEFGHFLTCKECTFAIPLAYVRDCRDMPPVFVQLFGLPNAGKTTFLDILRIYLYDLDRAWERYFPLPITQLDMDHRPILMLERERGILPGSTQKRERNQNEAYIMSLSHMERWGSRFLVLMDHAGESFGPLILNMQDIPFLQHTPVTIMLLSLPDLVNEGKRVNDLVTSYITSLEANRINFARERRQLVVVFSKADLIPDLPTEINEYLSRDNIYSALRDPNQAFNLGPTAMDHYIEWMKYISQVTEQWVSARIPGGRALLNMLRDREIQARFSVMSATGHPISPGAMLAPTPRRVLDPFFWVMEFYRENRL